MSRRRRAVFDGERKVPVFCTGRESHDRRNLGYILACADGHTVLRPRGGNVYQHYVSAADVRAGADWDVMPDGSPIGARGQFRCDICGYTLPIRNLHSDRLSSISEIDVSRVW